MGRTCRVFPAVLVREKVLNNNLGRSFLPAAEIEESVAAWNNIPVVIRHPTLGGQPVTARSPEVLNARGTGYIFDAGWDDDRRALTGEVWIVMEAAASVPDADQVVNRVTRGEPGELSTGFGVHIEATSGTWKGQEFDIILRDIEPDHLALLVEEVGACSVDDGCGLGVNCNCAEEHSMDDPQPQDPAVLVTEREEQDPPADPPEEDVTNASPEGAGEEEAAGEDASTGPLAQMARWFHRKMFGTQAEEAAENESDEDRRELLWQAVQDTFGGLDVFTWIEAVFSEEGLVVFGRETPTDNTGFFRSTFEIEDGAVTLGDAVEVRRVTSFEPVAQNAAAGHSTSEEEENHMNRDQLIARLAEASPLTAEQLGALEDAQLASLQEKYPEEEEGATPPTSDGAEEEDQAENQTEVINRLLSEVEALRKQQEEDRTELAQLRSVTQPAVEEQEREHERLVRTLAGNERCPFEEEELKAKDLAELRKLDRMARPTSYAGRGGPKAGAVQSAGDEPAFAEPVPYWQQEED